MALALFAALSTPMPAQAGAPLWRTLEIDDSPAIVKGKLEAMPEVKRVKIVEKKGEFSRLDINMNEGGVPIFDGHFDIGTAFTNGKLSAVQLTSGAGCLNDAYPFAVKVAEQLEKKYPEVGAPLVDASTFAIRALDATDTNPVTITSGYLSDDIGALFRSTFLRVDPPVYYGGSSISRSLYQLARSTYDLGAQKCGGAYYRTAQFSIIYLSRAELEAIKKDVETDAEADRRKAADNL